MEIAEVKVSYSSGIKDVVTIRDSKTSYKILKQSWNENLLELQEECKILLLNRNNTLLGVYPLSKGGVSGTIVDAKLIFSVALKCNASSIILAHNHPSGNLNPSEQDIKLTKKMKLAGSYLDIEILDHLILTHTGYFSFVDHGVLN